MHSLLTCTFRLQRHRFYRSLQFSGFFFGSRYSVWSTYDWLSMFRAQSFAFQLFNFVHSFECSFSYCFTFSRCWWNPTPRSGKLSRCIHHVCVCVCPRRRTRKKIMKNTYKFLSYIFLFEPSALITLFLRALPLYFSGEIQLSFSLFLAFRFR